jgi:hypothetical protein
MKRHESLLNHQVTISKEYRKALSPRDYLEELIAGCPYPVKKVVYEDVFIPTTVASSNTVEYDGFICQPVLRAIVLIEGEYSIDDIEAAFDYEQDHIRVFLDYVYENSE